MKGMLLFVIFSCCAWAGVYLYFQLKLRSQLLTELADMITRMEKIMGEQALTLKEALEWIGRTGHSEIQKKFTAHMLACWKQPQSLLEDWAKAAEALPHTEKAFAYLDTKEIDWLRTLPADQARMLADPDRLQRQWVDLWQSAAQQAQEKYRTRGPLYAKLGILIGAAIVALML